MLIQVLGDGGVEKGLIHLSSQILGVRQNIRKWDFEVQLFSP